MTWISLVCLLAITSSAFGRSVSYGSYGAASLPQASSKSLARDFTSQQTQQPFSQQNGYGQQQQQQQQQQSLVQPVQEEENIRPEIESAQTGYTQQYAAPSMIRKPHVQYDQSYNKVQLPSAPRTFASQAQLLQEQQQKLKQMIEESTVLTEADNLCRGQRPETVIPLDNGRRFVVCIDESKGYEQACPRGLLYHPESRRCERKLGPLENPCQSQPCLNNGQCVQTDFSSFKCQCAPGFDGEHCELDATVCQTQQPCGQSQDTRCQSFRWGAALQHMCILQNGRAYGLTASQAQPSPCTGVDGTFPLAFSDKGFIMCNGDLMYVESCPGGTVWDDSNKACVWPDMQGLSFEDQTPKVPTYNAPSYSAQRTMTPSYNAPAQLDESWKVPSSSYGQSLVKPIPQQKFIQKEESSSYGQSFLKPKMIQKDEMQSSYGNQIQMPVRQQDSQMPVRQQDSQMPVRQQDTQQPAYGGYQQTISKPIFQQPIRQQDFIRQPTSGY